MNGEDCPVIVQCEPDHTEYSHKLMPMLQTDDDLLEGLDMDNAEINIEPVSDDDSEYHSSPDLPGDLFHNEHVAHSDVEAFVKFEENGLNYMDSEQCREILMRDSIRFKKNKMGEQFEMDMVKYEDNCKQYGSSIMNEQAVSNSNEESLIKQEENCIKLEAAAIIEDEVLLDNIDENGIESDIEVPSSILQNKDALSSLNEIVEKNVVKPIIPSKELIHCKICGKLFKYPSDLQRHMMYHTGERPYVCPVCNKGFTRKQTLIYHVRTHDQSPYKCDTCGKHFKMRCGLIAHMKKHLTTSSGTYCTKCDVKFSDRFKLNRHRRLHTTDGLQCDICHDNFPFGADMRAHILTHTTTIMGAVWFCCYMCPERFREKRLVKSHLDQVHRSPKPVDVGKNFECEKCGFQCKFVHALKRHKEQHTDDKPHICRNCHVGFTTDEKLSKHNLRCCEHKCDQCDMVFKHASKYKRHRVEAHGQRILHICKHCNEVFYSPQSLAIHRRAHVMHSQLLHNVDEHIREITANHDQDSKEVVSYRWECSQCEAVFASRTGLRNHKPIHRPAVTTENPYQCLKCDRQFDQLSQLNFHQRAHKPANEQKIFSCHVCGKEFKRNGALNKHVLIHSDDRPFVCMICGATFKSNSNLSTHVKAHSEIKFSCKICNSKFNYKGSLRKHLRIHDSDRPHYCVLCKARFSTIGELEEHQMKHSNDIDCQYCELRFANDKYLGRHTRRVHPDKLLD